MGAIAWRFKGELRVTAILKASFAFAADAVMPRVDPQPIFPGDVHHAQNRLRSVLYPSDLVPYRKRADVIFTGYAYAPDPGATSMNVRLGVASGDRVILDKAIHVRKKAGVSRIAMLYEHALGGPAAPENPYGEEDDSDDLHLFDPKAPGRVAGFGPLSRVMGARSKLLGPVPLPPLGLAPVQIPDTFDFDFFQTAPADQQIAFLRGDEWVLIEGLHATAPRMCTCLPGARALARIHGLSEHGLPEGQSLALSADGLHVSGEDERCTVTWRGTFAVPNAAALASVRIVAGVETPGEPVAWPDAESIARAEPIAPGPISAPPSSAEATLALSESEIIIISSSSPSGPDATLPVASSVTRSALPPLPFRASAPGAVSAIAKGSSAPRSRGDAGSTLPIDSRTAPRVAPLPFRIAGQPATPAPVAEKPLPPPEKPAPPPEKPSPASSTLPEAKPAPLPPAPEPPAKEPPAKKAGSVWADAPEAAKPPPPPPQPKKLPPKVNIGNKLYGTRKKG